MNHLFIELIQISIGAAGCLSRTPSEAEWGELYAMAKKQSLVGICFAGVKKLQKQSQCPPEMLYLQWIGMAAKIQQRNELVNRRCVELQNRLAAYGFRSFIMKGQGNSALYRASYENEDEDENENHVSINHKPSTINLQNLRQSGDIDIYLEGGVKKLLNYARTFGTITKVNELEMSVPVFPDTEVEFHFKPFMIDGPKDKVLQRFFDGCKEENFNNTLNLSYQLLRACSPEHPLERKNPSEPLMICTPTTKFNLVHQLVHIHHHLFYEGIGLRQLMDYYFVLRSVKNVESVKESKECIHNLGLDRFASALMWVIGHVFDPQMLEIWNLKPETALWKPNEKDGSFLLNEIMLSGNFGKQDERQKGLYDSKWNSFWMVHFKTFRLWRYDHWAWFWSPICRIKGFVWRKVNGFK